MKGKKNINKSALAVSISLLVVLILLIGTFILSQMRFNKDNIVLPIGPSDTGIASTPEDMMKNDLVQVTRDNVVKVLETLHKPKYYHQKLEVIVGVNYPKATRVIELWVSESMLHAEITFPTTGAVKSVITDGQTVWIWYDTDFVPVSIELSKDTSIEDLLGIPKFDFLQHLKQSVITDAGYGLFEDTTQQCVYVTAQESKNINDTYWIDLKTGLLQSVIVTEAEGIPYCLKSTSMEILASQDDVYTGRFCLPNGSKPFTEAE